jgi:hypothetical protein
LSPEDRGLFPLRGLHRNLLLLSRRGSRLLLSRQVGSLLLHQLPLTSHGGCLLHLVHLLSDQRRHLLLLGRLHLSARLHLPALTTATTTPLHHSVAPAVHHSATSARAAHHRPAATPAGPASRPAATLRLGGLGAEQQRRPHGHRGRDSTSLGMHEKTSMWYGLSLFHFRQAKGPDPAAEWRSCAARCDRSGCRLSESKRRAACRR